MSGDQGLYVLVNISLRLCDIVILVYDVLEAPTQCLYGRGRLGLEEGRIVKFGTFACSRECGVDGSACSGACS